MQLTVGTISDFGKYSKVRGDNLLKNLRLMTIGWSKNSARRKTIEVILDHYVFAGSPTVLHAIDAACRCGYYFSFSISVSRLVLDGGR